MNAKHTPGPWWATNHGVRDRGGYIAHTNSVQRYEGQDDRYAFEVAQREADKLLIAAAPDLLEALQALAGLYPSTEEMNNSDDYSVTEIDWVEIARAAIAKATNHET
jgi:hypothetical protein